MKPNKLSAYITQRLYTVLLGSKVTPLEKGRHNIITDKLSVVFAAVFYSGSYRRVYGNKVTNL